MMTVVDWRKKAHDCMTASQRASDRDGQSGWRALSEAWLVCAEWRDRVKFDDNATRVVRAVSANADATRTGAIGYGDRLRKQLSLMDAQGITTESMVRTLPWRKPIEG
jgi:hypothetical protein